MSSDMYKAMQAVTVRIVCVNDGGIVSIGTGIRLEPNTFLTCAHVLIGVDRLRSIADDANREKRPIADEFASRVQAIRTFTVIGNDGTERPASVLWWDLENNIACIQVDIPGTVADIDSAGMTPGQEVYLFGFPYAIDTPEREWPSAVYPGMVSRTISAFVGGTERRPYVEIAGVSFGGNSGGPVVDRATGKIVGMVCGYMVWGRDDVVTMDNEKNMQVGSTETPVGISYATVFDRLERVN